jgi:hypothetical protein
MDSILDEFDKLQKPSSISFAADRCGLKCQWKVTDEASPGAAIGASMYDRPCFADGKTLHQEGYRVFLRSDNPTLLGMAQRCEPVNRTGLASSLRWSRDWETMLQPGKVVRGWSGFDRDSFGVTTAPARTPGTANYPFQRTITD